jgi:ABC-2 type transport system permease protein
LHEQHPLGGGASTFGRSLLQERRSLVGWGIGITATILMELALYPTVRSNDMSKLAESYPEAIKKLFNLSDFSTGAGYVRAELFSLVVPMLFVVLAVLWGSDSVAGEQERKTLDLVLANPISRRRFLLEKAGGLCTGLGILGIAAFVTLVAGGAIFDVGIAIDRLVAVVLATFLTAALFGLLALTLGAATGHRGFARGVSAALAVLAYLLSSLAPLVSWLEPWRVTSPWYQTLGSDPIGAGVTWHLLVPIAVAGAALVVGVTLFERRDLIS